MVSRGRWTAALLFPLAHLGGGCAGGDGSDDVVIAPEPLSLEPGEEIVELCASFNLVARNVPPGTHIAWRSPTKEARMTTKTFVAVTDSARAKLFFLDSSRGPERLSPLLELQNSDRRIRPSEQFSVPRPGLRQARPGGGRHDVDDGREAHLHEHDRKFAAEIVATLRRHHRAEGLEALVITAPPSFLGVMRPALFALEREQVSIHLSGKELTGMGSAAIHDHLATQGLLPARGRTS